MAKKCKQCKATFSPRNTLEAVCGFECAILFAKTPKGDDHRMKAVKKESRADLKLLNRKSLKWQHGLTQKAFNKMRVLEELLWFKERGLRPECISCGGKDKDWCCGHFKTVGSQGVLRYDRENTYLQCNRYCNMGLSGNINGNKNTRGYTQGLIDRFGKEAIEIIDYCETNIAAVKWEWQQLEDMRAEFNEKIRGLVKNAG